MLLSAKHYESCRHQRDQLSPPSSVEIKPGYPASMKLLLSLPTIMSKCCFFTFFYNRNVFKKILNKSNKCRDVQYGDTLVM